MENNCSLIMPNINAENWTMPSQWGSFGSLTSDSGFGINPPFAAPSWDNQGIYSPYSTFGTNPSFSGTSSGNNSNPSFTRQQIEDALDKVSVFIAEKSKELGEAANNASSVLMSTGSFVAMENAHKLRHPILSAKAAREADKIFKPGEKTTADAKSIAKTWKKHPEEVKKAYNEVLHAYRSLEKKNKFFSGWWRKTWTGNDKAYIEGLIKNLQSAMKSGNMEQVVELTTKLEQTKAFNGKIPTAMKWIKEKVTRKAKPSLSAEERVTKNTKQITKAVNKFKKAQAATSFTQKALRFGSKALKQFGGFAIFDGAIELFSKVVPTWKKDKEKGKKQALQSGVKVAASCGAWAIGRTAGSVLGAKLGATIGTAFCPGLGTAIGAVLGIGLGCLASWAAEKAVEHYIPVDESEKLEAKAALDTEEGKKEALNTLAQLKQSGAEIPEDVVNAAKVLSYNA